VTGKEITTKRYTIPLNVLQLRSIRNSSSKYYNNNNNNNKIIGRTPKTD